MDWSIYRREHQAEARRHHVKRRLAVVGARDRAPRQCGGEHI
jgi:hypothetical protein